MKYRSGSVRRRSELGIKRKSDQNLPWFQIKMLGLRVRVSCQGEVSELGVRLRFKSEVLRLGVRVRCTQPFRG